MILFGLKKFLLISETKIGNIFKKYAVCYVIDL